VPVAPPDHPPAGAPVVLGLQHGPDPDPGPSPDPGLLDPDANGIPEEHEPRVVVHVHSDSAMFL